MTRQIPPKITGQPTRDTHFNSFSSSLERLYSLFSQKNAISPRVVHTLEPHHLPYTRAKDLEGKKDN